jgi:hypothetical protein
MPSFTDLSGLASVAIAGTSACVLMPGIARLAKPRLAILLGVVFVMLLIPFSELPFAAYLRGATGDLSITTLLLLWCALLRPWFDCGMIDAKSHRALLIPVVFAALLLYPLALGVSSFDPYRLGYGDPQFVVLLLLAALAAWIWKYYLITLCIAFAILAWAIGWYESGNLWDYLLDPFVSIYALFTITRHTVKTLLQRSKSLA